MKRVITPPRAEARDEMLRDLRVSSTVFCRSDMGAPWGFAVKGHGQAAFHIVLEGGCLLQVDGVPDPVRLGAGDLVVLPRGPGHRLTSGAGAPVELLDDILARHGLRDGQLRYGGQGRRTDLVCGVFEIEDANAMSMLRALPAVIHLDEREHVQSRWLAPLLATLEPALRTFEPGAESVAALVANIILLQAVRAAVDPGATAGQLVDPQVARAIQLMRDNPGSDWTVERLAAAVHSSRTAFAERFKRATGEPPRRYLTRLRLAAAARELRVSNAGLAEIARRVGYGSEAALSRAFTREMRVAPMAYRGQARGQRSSAA